MIIAILSTLVFIAIIVHIGILRSERKIKKAQAELDYQIKRQRILTEAAFILNADFHELDEILNTRGITHD